MFNMNRRVLTRMLMGSSHFFCGGANVSRTLPAPAIISSPAFARAIWMSL
jgi:hypothetical protein